jgi:hypothetical protein
MKGLRVETSSEFYFPGWPERMVVVMRDERACRVELCS